MTFDRRTAIGIGVAGFTTMTLPGLAAPASSRFQVKSDTFMLDGKPFQILAGEMHYPRIPRALWRDRLRKLRALCFSTRTAAGRLTCARRSSPETGPAFYRGTLNIAEAGFTFLDMRGWGKGYVWVNGHNPGRYWAAGPQRAMFVPAPRLKVGANEVIVLDLFGSTERVLSGTTHMIWDTAAKPPEA
jgi:beta-galactosidase GanA